jgi:hypothetical protein
MATDNDLWRISILIPLIGSIRLLTVPSNINVYFVIHFVTCWEWYIHPLYLLEAYHLTFQRHFTRIIV